MAVIPTLLPLIVFHPSFKTHFHSLSPVQNKNFTDHLNRVLLDHHRAQNYHPRRGHVLCPPARTIPPSENHNRTADPEIKNRKSRFGMENRGRVQSECSRRAGEVG